MPKGLQLYRYWIGGNNKTGVMRTLDLSEAKGSGCSAVLHAAEQGYKHIFCIAFDMLGAEQYRKPYTLQSREQNNIYKNTKNYDADTHHSIDPSYWIYQAGKVFEHFPNIEFRNYNKNIWPDKYNNLTNYAVGDFNVGN